MADKKSCDACDKVFSPSRIRYSVQVNWGTSPTPRRPSTADVCSARCLAAFAAQQQQIDLRNGIPDA